MEWEKKELKKQNEALTGRLYATGNTQDLIAHLNAENSKFKAEIKQLHSELESTQSELNEYKKQESKTKVTPINQPW